MVPPLVVSNRRIPTETILMRLVITVLLATVCWCRSAKADEPRMLRGRDVEGWIQVLRDSANTDKERRQAVSALGEFGPEAWTAIPNLIDEVRRGPLKYQAVDALVRIGAGTKVTVPFLIERFREEGCVHFTGAGTFFPNFDIRNSLIKIGSPAVPALLEILNGPDHELRVCAADALGGMGPAARAAVPTLMRAIEHPEPGPHSETLSHCAVRALGRIGPEAKDAVPILNGLLNDEDHGNDVDTVVALNKIGVPPVRYLVDRILRDGDPFTAFELGWLGPHALDAIPALRKALADKRPQIRFSAATALAYIDSSETDAIPVLTEALDYWNDKEITVAEASRALGRFGPRAKTAIGKLIMLVKRGFQDTELFRSLVEIDPDGEECVPVLIAALKHEEYDVVKVAAECLGLLGPRAKAAVPILAETLTRDLGTLERFPIECVA